MSTRSTIAYVRNCNEVLHVFWDTTDREGCPEPVHVSIETRTRETEITLSDADWREFVASIRHPKGEK